jgi:hypothetical protein
MLVSVLFFLWKNSSNCKKIMFKKEYFIAMFPFFWIFGAKFQEKKLSPLDSTFRFVATF